LNHGRDACRPTAELRITPADRRRALSARRDRAALEISIRRRFILEYAHGMRELAAPAKPISIDFLIARPPGRLNDGGGGRNRYGRHDLSADGETPAETPGDRLC